MRFTSKIPPVEQHNTGTFFAQMSSKASSCKIDECIRKLQADKEELLAQAYLEMRLGESGGYYFDQASGAHRDIEALKKYCFEPNMYVRHAALDFVGMITSLREGHAVVQWESEALGYLDAETHFRHLTPLKTLVVRV